MRTVQAVTSEPETATGGDIKGRIAAFMTGFTAETTPGSAAKIPDYREHLRPGAVVKILPDASPRGGAKPANDESTKRGGLLEKILGRK